MGKEIEIGEQSIQNIFKLHRNMEPRKLSYSGCKDISQNTKSSRYRSVYKTSKKKSPISSQDDERLSLNKITESSEKIVEIIDRVNTSDDHDTSIPSHDNQPLNNIKNQFRTTSSEDISAKFKRNPKKQKTALKENAYDGIIINTNPLSNDKRKDVKIHYESHK